MWVVGLDGLVNTDKLDEIQVGKKPEYINYLTGSHVVSGYGQITSDYELRTITRLFVGGESECEEYVGALAQELDARQYSTASVKFMPFNRFR